MTDALNISKMLEQAQQQGLIDAGVNEATTFLNFCQVAQPREVKIPQIWGGCSPDIPEGTDTDKFSEFRIVHSSLRIMINAEEDEDRKVMNTLFIQVRTMIETANTQRQAWQNAILVGCKVNAVIPTESPPPVIEPLVNGDFVWVMEQNSDWMISVT